MKNILKDIKKDFLKLNKNHYKKLLKKEIELKEKLNNKSANNGRIQ